MILKEYLDKNYTNEEQNKLTYLNCSGKGITSFSCASLEGIEQLTNLKWLYCSGNNLTSLKGMGGIN